MIKKIFTPPQELAITPQKRQFYSMMLMLSLFAAIVTAFQSLVLFILNLNVIVSFFPLAISIICFVLHFLVRSGRVKAAFYGLVYLVFLCTGIGVYTLGWQSGYYLYLFVMIPTISFNSTVSHLEKIILTIVFLIVILVIGFISFTNFPLTGLSVTQYQFLNLSNLILVGLALGGISYFYTKSTRIAEDALLGANEKLTYLASRDSLTNLFNRRRMNELIELEHIRSQRSKKPFCLIMVDADNFKDVNDAYGHPAGDAVLTQVANLFTTRLRKQDMISRWGGEEFLILLPETDNNGAKIVVSKLRDLIAHTSFYYHARLIKMTLTFGGAECLPSEPWDECLKHADGALYFGKQHGKNQMICYNNGTYEILTVQNQ